MIKKIFSGACICLCLILSTMAGVLWGGHIKETMDAKANKSVIYHYSAEYRDSSGDNGSTRAMAGDGIFSTTVPPSDPNFMAKIREMIATSAVPPISSNKIVIRSLTPLGVGVIQHK